MGQSGKGRKKTKEAMVSSLRESLFSQIPPFISSIPVLVGKQDWTTPIRLNPPVDQHDQLWRITSAINQVVSDVNNDRNVAQKHAFDSCYPFRKNNLHAADFRNRHALVSMKPFPNLIMLSKKDQLWQAVRRKAVEAEKEGRGDEWAFLSFTFVLPDDWDSFWYLLITEPRSSLWIVKPSSMNRGMGIRLINRDATKAQLEELQNTKDSICLQRYIANPFLLSNCLKFDIRVYVLVTSWDPIRIYMYKDGLVKFCVNKYSMNPEGISDLRTHVTNPEVNKKGGQYKSAKDPDSVSGHKWRLEKLWESLAEDERVGKEGVERLWKRIGDIVIRTLLCADNRLRNKFSARRSMYNCYNLTGFDIMVDSALDPHLLEVNTKPQLLPLPLDRSVNEPMISEMLRIVGFHLPPYDRRERCSAAKVFQFEDPDMVNGFRYKLYSTVSDSEQLKKEEKVSGQRRGSPDLLKELTPLDVRRLVKAEDELNAADGFERIFPTSETYFYFEYFEDEDEAVPYSERLMDAYETEFSGDRVRGRQMLESYCMKGAHLS